MYHPEPTGVPFTQQRVDLNQQFLKSFSCTSDLENRHLEAKPGKNYIFQGAQIDSEKKETDSSALQSKNSIYQHEKQEPHCQAKL